jgi:ABC-type dipeptide/oligopeptide/nickel transport system permease component
MLKVAAGFTLTGAVVGLILGVRSFRRANRLIDEMLREFHTESGGADDE